MIEEQFCEHCKHNGEECSQVLDNENCNNFKVDYEILEDMHRNCLRHLEGLTAIMKKMKSCGNCNNLSCPNNHRCIDSGENCDRWELKKDD